MVAMCNCDFSWFARGGFWEMRNYSHQQNRENTIRLPIPSSSSSVDNLGYFAGASTNTNKSGDGE